MDNLYFSHLTVIDVLTDNNIVDNYTDIYEHYFFSNSDNVNRVLHAVHEYNSNHSFDLVAVGHVLKKEIAAVLVDAGVLKNNIYENVENITLVDANTKITIAQQFIDEHGDNIQYTKFDSWIKKHYNAFQAEIMNLWHYVLDRISW